MLGAAGSGARIAFELRSRRLITGTGQASAVPNDPVRGIVRCRSGVVNAGVLGESSEETAAWLDALIERYYPTLLIWPLACGVDHFCKLRIKLRLEFSMILILRREVHVCALNFAAEELSRIYFEIIQ
jgi:hypothetical protein